MLSCSSERTTSKKHLFIKRSDLLKYFYLKLLLWNQKVVRNDHKRVYGFPTKVPIPFITYSQFVKVYFYTAISTVEMMVFQIRIFSTNFGLMFPSADF